MLPRFLLALSKDGDAGVRRRIGDLSYFYTGIAGGRFLSAFATPLLDSLCT
jgi:hypothetical protein